MPGNLVFSHGRFGASIKCAARSGGLSGLISACTTLRAGADMGVSLADGVGCLKHIAPAGAPPGRMRRAQKRQGPKTTRLKNDKAQAQRPARGGPRWATGNFGK